MVDTWGESSERSAFLLRSSRPAAGTGGGVPFQQEERMREGDFFFRERKPG